ncbi:hypothetical protein PAMA_020110 [Pampus argenteus]
MKRKVAKLRLSPNEEAQLIREEHERRRKLRIQQVREQQKYIALQIRRDVEQRRRREMEQLEEELREDWERQQREKLNTLQRLYQESLQLLGQGHRSAKENEPDMAAIAQKEEENQSKAEERYREALKELKSQRLKDHERQIRSINARKKALQAEKERSAKVASLPPPPPANPIQQNIDSKKPHAVKKSDVSAFAATHYHMPETAVDREVDTEQPNAHEEAELEVKRLQDLQREEERRREEQLEKARLRGKQALRKEQLVQDRERLLDELEHMQQTDLLRRRQQVSQMPPQIFQPLYKRHEMREDFQREMEFAFEDMYTGERRVKGDLVVQLAPEPLPALSTDSQDQELDVTLDEIPTLETENTQQGTEQEAGSTEQETSAHVEPSRPAPRRALRKLLDRIRNQRNQWTNHSNHNAAATSLTVITDQIPERDTTIDTGSLTSEERDVPEPTQSPPPLGTTEQSTAADTRLPDVLANRIQEFEEARKKREVELEREKQQQVVLLQELEEQKAKLEQMLLEAQQEREHLKAAVTQEVTINTPVVPVRSQEVTHSLEPAPPAGEDEHSRRIREYQQRLLEQNRVHRRSVEVARQRLEEYQRALRIRYNMTTASMPRAVVPPGLIYPPLHSAQCVHFPTPLQRSTTPPVPAHIPAKLQTPVEVPTGESDTLAAPPHLPGSSLSVDSKLQPEEVESISNSSRNQIQDVTAQMTDSIMEKVTEHLPERLRHSSVTMQPLPYKMFTTTASPLQPTSDPIGAVSLGVTGGTRQGLGQARVQPGTLPHGSQQTGCQREDDMESQRQELQEVQRQVLEQREAVALQQRRQEEERQRQEEQLQRQEVEMEHMRRQKEVLEALIDADAQPAPHVGSEVFTPEDIGQTRLKLLASLLRAIEESNGGTLSHLENHQEEDDSPQLQPSTRAETDPIAQSKVPAEPAPTLVLPSGLLPPPRAAKPPVTRVRLGIMMTEQHELSAIQEVETPVNTSHVTGPEDNVNVVTRDADWNPQEESDSSVASDSSGQQAADGPTGSETSSRRSSHLIWRERLLTGPGTSPESSESDSVRRNISPFSFDSGRGADYSDPGITSYRSFTESVHRPPDSDCLSSTTISTGSYVTTDPEQNVNTDESRHHRHCVEQGGETHLHVSSPSGQSSCIMDDSAAGRSAPAVDSLFNDSSIQRIIDKYKRELNFSLSTAGKTADSESSFVEEPDFPVSQQPLVQVSKKKAEDERSTGHHSLMEWDNTVSPVLERFSGEATSVAESFRPLIGQLADQSSYLAADQRDSAMEQLVGQPSAHSSMIGQLPGPPASVSMDQGRWDFTLSRMIGRLSHQSSSHWLSGGQDFYAGQLIAQMEVEQSTTWLDEGPEESWMRPLVGELDETAGQQSQSSGERTCVDLGVSTDASVPSYPALPPEASSHSASVPGATSHPQNQTGPMELDPERTEDSFHPLLAEVTHNETADPSMTFHLPEHDAPGSPEERPPSGGCRLQTCTDHSVESEPSPERLRTEEPSMTTSTALHESFSQLVTSQCHAHESVLMVSPTTQDVELTAQSLSHLTVCEEEEADRKDEDSVPLGDLHAREPESEQSSNLNVVPVSDKILEAAGKEGILEQSEITLVSMTDTTLDKDMTVSEEEETWEDKHPEEFSEEGQRGQEMEESESTLTETSPVALKEDEHQTHPATLLELQWGPSRGQQEAQKRRAAFLQRSTRRVEEIKAKGALVKAQREIQAPPETGEQSKTKESPPVAHKVKTKSEPQDLKRNLKTNTKSKGGKAEQAGNKTTDKSDFRQKKPPVSEMKICTSEQKRRDASEMHRRTQRLYEQLEEVKLQKEVRSRQEACAKNRLKAKEFHTKTLQKLRAKQTRL